MEVYNEGETTEEVKEESTDEGNESADEATKEGEETPVEEAKEGEQIYSQGVLSFQHSQSCSFKGGWLMGENPEPRNNDT